MRRNYADWLGRWEGRERSARSRPALHSTINTPRSTLSIFAFGLSVRLLGVLFIWLGDGHDQWWRKAFVILGVVLTFGGIGVLKFLLVKGLDMGLGHAAKQPQV
jgi:hypothetical protein